MRPRDMKTLVGLMLLVATIAGALVGSGLAYASDVFQNLSPGDNGYTSYHSDDYIGYNIHDNYTDYKFIYRSDDGTTCEIYNVHKYGGYVTPDAARPNVAFGYAYYYDQQGYHSVLDDWFASVEIYGCDNYSYPDWIYSGFSQSNNYVEGKQWIWYGDPASGYTTLGTDYDVYYVGN